MKILDDLKKLRAEATPLPWDDVISTGCVRYLGPPVQGKADHGDYIANCQGRNIVADAELIATAVNNLDALIAVAEAAERAVKDEWLAGTTIGDELEKALAALARRSTP